MRRTTLIVLFILSALLGPLRAQQQLSQALLDVLPASGQGETHHGWAGAFIGQHNEVVVMAGGSAFPGAKPWEDGQKKFTNELLLGWEENGQFTWHKDKAQLPKMVAGGAAVSLPEGILCTGGANAQEVLADAWLIKVANQTSEIIPFASLPFPLKDHGIAVIGRDVYIAGGVTPQGYNSHLLVYNLDNPENGWQMLAGLPHGITNAVVESQMDGSEQCLYVIGGRYKQNGNSVTTFSNEVWKFTPSQQQWTKKNAIQLSNKNSLALAAAAGVKIGASHIVLVGGDTGHVFNRVEKAIGEMTSDDEVVRQQAKAQRNELWLNHPGFNKDILVYNTITDSWFSPGKLNSNAPAVTSAVFWQNKVVVPSGEVSPGVRTNQVIALDFQSNGGFGWLNYVVLVLYFIAMLLLGFYFMKREGDEQDFFKAGGRIPWWAAGISIFATTLSAITFIAIPAKAYATDWRMLLFNFTIIMVVPVIIRYYLPFFRRLNIGTAYEYLEMRFNRTVRWVASVLFILFMITRIAIVLFLPSLALHTVTGFSVYWSIIIMGVVTIVYCTSGGIEAVVWGDVIQGFILFAGALFALVFMVAGVDGGLGGFIQLSLDQDKLFLFDSSLDWSKPVMWVVLLGGFANSLIAYTSDQSVVQRYMTTKDERATARSIWLNGIISVPVSIIFFLLGTGLYAFYTSNPGAISITIPNLDAVFPHFIVSEMPAGLAGLLIAAVFAAAMSTLSSNINSVAAVITSDFYKVLKANVSAQSTLLVARWSGIIVGVFGIAMALVLATWDIASLWDQFNTFLGLLTGGLAAFFMMGIFFKRISGVAALIGVGVGLVVLSYLRNTSDMSFLLYGVAGISVSVCVGWLLSFIWPSKSVNDELVYEGIKSNQKKT
ncbi:sodium:solute symporter family transporter [Carboxylicivirga taeanensis]|uniref:sodium:solute symporter family transporter n=1 Tax=Carboxylicivirga taeanensis TaxID=1416875 RepID=UPI003F6E2BE9